LSRGNAVSDSAPLIVERHADGYATIVFNRPDKLNTLSIALRRDLAAAVAALEADPMLGKRLRRMRASRQRQRSARRLGLTL
jgi:hypothetical protein